MHPFPTSDESFARLHRAGWSVGDTSVITATGIVRIVSGVNGENVLEARAATQAEAWYRASQQAKALGMLSWR
jgi:hypothetical protein